ncbi:MAG: SUF system Fe-S cluster assembly regulator [Sphingomonadales bacterium]|nr:SUF system Fe-S cluster assembly regulator [Sphingomonadales bacterium]PIX65855.1 MAG: SUF system Fe-S cluster assembly regulator [Sphingomonadales bacterium CG_4_10_14_3_um_filter_58_15]NCO50364.1 SUF system Fe-S cluster assembly regulator [Sphingomonadales bacterium]NCO99042.1 SUF system Fe-S cluster assembly regulator [Sphingomonadales bacterium]NCP25587.1 SUF system Fe-S cluster assembly regulator [Sphingomonadales bacterium]
MRLSNLADYAVVLMSAAARHCGAARLAEGRLNATKLAQETGVPLPTAKKLVSRLTAAGLFESTRGIGGGIRLARPPASISLADIVEAVEGPLAITSCTIDGNHDCLLESGCTVKPHWGVVNRTIRQALDDVSLASLSDIPSTHMSHRSSRTQTRDGDHARSVSTSLDTNGIMAG